MDLYSQCSFLLTSRPRTYEIAPVQHGFTLEVLRFNPEQQKLFLRNWYFAHALQAQDPYSNTRPKKADLMLEAIRETDELLLRLKKKPEIYDLTSNPLLLYLIAATHHISNRKLPENRLELYKDICEQLLGKVKESWLIAKNRGKVLQSLAALMMEYEQLEGISTAEAFPVLADTMREIDLPADEENLGRFLTEAAVRSSLLLEYNDRWRFDHRTFQEYFAACHYNQKYRQKGLNAFPRLLDKLVENTFWSDTLRLFALLGHASMMVTICLDKNSVNSLRLASEILDEDKEVHVKQELRSRLEQRIKDDLESSDTERRNFAAEIVLSKRLRKHWKPIDEGFGIDPSPIINAEYLFFLDKTNQNTAAPGYWSGSTWPVSSAEKPILGATGYQAQAFVDWLNCWDTTNSWNYRLPSSNEMAELTTNPSERHSYWIQFEPDSHYVEGLSKNKRIEIETDCQKMSGLPLRLRFCCNAVLDQNLFGGTTAEMSNIEFARDYARARLSNDQIARKFEANPEHYSLKDFCLREAEAIGPNEIRQAMRASDFETALQSARELPEQDEGDRNRKETLVSTLAILAAKDEREQRAAWWKNVSVQTKFAYLHCQNLVKLEKRTRRKKYEDQGETLLQLHWYALINSQRISDPDFPVWEAIRLVRERKSMS